MLSTDLAVGTTVHLSSWGMDCVVERRIGGGGQGAVYAVRVPDDGNRQLALKWYTGRSAVAYQEEVLRSLIDRGPPTAKGSPDQRFVWPLDMARVPGSSLFGYVMRLMPPDYLALIDCVTNEVPTTFRSRVTAGLQLADSFDNLHNDGLCYRDVSLGNVALMADNGHIHILDNDNVGFNGTPSLSVAGTLGFMAPEVQRREAYPSTETDWHSLAVLLFYLLVRHHPLIGKAETGFTELDTQAYQQLFANHPVFIFDPDDRSNEPVPGAHDNALAIWPLLPTSTRELFTQAFTVGLRDPAHSRVTDSAWRVEFARLLDSIYPCPECGAEHFDDPTGDGTAAPVCWRCNRPLVRPPLLDTGRDRVALFADARLYPHHLRRPLDGRIYDYSAPVAVVTRHPRDPNVLGLTNLTTLPWAARTAKGKEVVVPPERSVIITPGLRVDLGGVDAIVDDPAEEPAPAAPKARTSARKAAPKTVASRPLRRG